jgi:hypothetical protein
MKNIKSAPMWAIFVLALAMLAPLAGCGNNRPPELADKWIQESGPKRNKLGGSIELFKDGTGVFDGTSVTWKVENKRLVVLSSTLGMSCSYKVSKGTLTLTSDDGESTTFVNFATVEKLLQERRSKLEADAQANIKAIMAILDQRKADTGFYGQPQTYTYKSNGQRPKMDLLPGYFSMGDSKLDFTVTIDRTGLAYTIAATDPSQKGATVLTADQSGKIQAAKG